ncbi:glycine cleavage system aminomethyltransferase GcvT [Salinarimonas ramus]|uniref:aminomethyltransferase n=1 Tax=Salinarimonas ramus TaxID=690164 RepID=A0A917V9L5_9HYPH|nr:glycine cleavage system aminomethyltransferase GcvT [Salinarimonas ramus]GGK51970.1 aminomethyltransferase [Salinarimonas ramus]
MADSQAGSGETLLHTPLHASHVAAGARIVPFAGYAMPVQYPAGILAEHLWTRAQAGLFDVSHMGQATLVGPDHETTARALETLVPAAILELKPGQQRYTQLLTDEGGILDDLMVSRPTAEADQGKLHLVVNAGTKEGDYAHMAARLPANVRLERHDDRALLALQGPAAEAVMADAGAADAVALTFMRTARLSLHGHDVLVSRSGYTGEDGWEISVAAADAPALWDALLADERVKPIGLGARDSLRLEAGLCLYGHDIDTTTSPVEAGLVWSIQKRRREEGGFPGAARIQRELAEGPARVRIGIALEGRAPAREGAAITTPDGEGVGVVTSGGFGPSVERPIVMGYVRPDMAEIGRALHCVVRGKALVGLVAPLPFTPARFKR